MGDRTSELKQAAMVRLPYDEALLLVELSGQLQDLLADGGDPPLSKFELAQVEDARSRVQKVARRLVQAIG